jgi:hypothetical protein
MTRATTVALLVLALALGAWGEYPDLQVPLHGAQLHRANAASPHGGISFGVSAPNTARESAEASTVARAPQLRSSATARAGVIPLRI